MTAVDFGRAAADYGQWRQGFPAEFFLRLDALGVGRAGQRIADARAQARPIACLADRTGSAFVHRPAIPRLATLRASFPRTT